MKTAYYVANVTNAYRRAFDLIEKGLPFDEKLYEELEKSSHRRYTTGFYFDETDREHIDTSLPISTYDFIANVVEDASNGYVKVEQRNRFKVGEELEILSPSNNFNKTFVVTEIIDDKGQNIDDALKVQQIVSLKCPFDLKKGDILRKKSTKHNNA